MGQYEYFKPESLDNALKVLSQNKGDSAIVAGGTDMMVQIHKGMKSPGVLIDISDLEELQQIIVRQDFVEIGATVTHTQINENEEVRKYFPVLAEAAGEVGSPQIRNAATVGGNLGNGSPAADVVPALFVIGAEAIIQNTAGTRRVKVADLPVRPGKIALEQDEIITGFVIPKPKQFESSAFMKLGKRKALAISVVNAAANVELDSEKKVLVNVRLAVGSVAPTTRGLGELEELLKGKEISESTLEYAQQKASELVKPITDIRGSEEYRKQVTGALIRKALKKSIDQILDA